MAWLNEGPGQKSILRQKREKAIRMSRDVYEGTLHLRELGDPYLVQFPKEDPDGYKARLAVAVLWNAYKRTIGGLVGMVLRKPPACIDCPEVFVEHAKDIDLAGRNLAMFAQDNFTESWIDGLSVIFTDKPPVPAGATKDETAHLRPYWIVVTGDAILGGSTERINGVDVVTRIRWREETVEVDPTDEFKEVEVPRVREYRLVDEAIEGSDQTRKRVAWRTWELRETGEKRQLEWVPGEEGFLGEQMDEIPVSVTYTNRKGVLDAEPGLIDLACENVRHFQKLSDKDNNEHIACVPIFTTIGAEEDQIVQFTIGPSVGLALPQGADAKYVETQGSGSATVRESLKDAEHRMAMLGLSTLHPDPKWGVTATATRIDKSESDSQLGAAAQSLQKALNNARRLHLKWMGLEDEGEISLNVDFENLRMDAQTLTALAALVPTKLSLETFLERVKAGGLLPDSFDPELELERIEKQDTDLLATVRKLMGEKGGKPKPGEEEDEDITA